MSAGDSEPLLETEGLTKHFDQTEGILDRLLGGKESVQAVEGVDLTVRDGETLAVVGESGCGKSTLAETIINLHSPTAGAVRFQGEDITDLPEREMRQYRRRIQMIFQDPLASLNPRQTVEEILTAPMEVHDIGADDEERTELAEAHLERVGLEPSALNRYPHQFSGGQQQRIAVARALTLEPDLLLADEPVSALDVSIQAQILELLEDLQEELGIAMVFIAHDLSVVRYIADRVAVMYLGEIVERAPTEELFEDPQHPYTRSLLSAVPRIDPEKRTDRVILQGSPPSPIDPPDGCRFHTRCPALIPPPDWPGSQPAFRNAFTFRTRVLNGEIEVEAVRARIESDTGEVTDEAVEARIIEQSLPGELDALPDGAADAVRDAASALVDGTPDQAAERVRTAFRSPCEDREPRTVATAGDREAACHRVDPEAPGEPTVD